MKKTILDFSLGVIGRGIVFTLLFAFTLTTYGQTPTGEPNPYFCSKASWKSGGFPKMPGDNLGDLQVNGENLKWYEDKALTKPISNPNKKILVDGASYYVTQTVGGVESTPLKVTVMDRACGCIKEPDFETQDNKLAAPGYVFYSQPIIPYHKTCDSRIYPTDPVLPFSTTLNDFSVRANGVDNTSPNEDPSIAGITRTDPADIYSSKGIRLNNNGNGQVLHMTKEFVAGEVFSFRFALLLENPSGHNYEQQPYFQVRIYDKNNNVVQERCIVSSPTDCVFNVGQNPLYAEWSCLKLNTLGIQGEYARAQITVADCTQSGHFGYAYIDNLYVGDDGAGCGDISFGYLAVNSIGQAQGTGSCYVTQAAQQATCSAGALASMPFPIEVCGVYNAPISSGNPAQLDSLRLNIIQNNNVVGTVTAPALNTGKQTFCFTVDETDINVDPYGDFDFLAQIDYDMDCGEEYDILIDDRSSVQICPPAGCVDPLIACDDTGTGFASFDLTQANALIRNGFKPADVGLSFYKTRANALNEKNKIKNPKKFTNTVKGKQTIYVRLDWKVTPQGCTYLVKLDLMVKDLPKVDLGVEDEIVVCGDGPFSIPLVATPSNLADLNVINYNWFKSDTVRLPTLGSIYYVTEPGKYSVTVSNDIACEVTKTVVVERVDYSVDLGGAQLDLCDVSKHTLTAKITDEGSSPALAPSLFKYKWNTGETKKSINITESGTYSVEATYKGCTIKKSIIVNIADRPEISLGADFKICVNGDNAITATVSNFNAGKLEYTWYRDGGVVSGEAGSSLAITKPGIYRAEVHEPNAAFCVGTDEITVELYANENCIIPQGISPNGDQYNQSMDLTFLDDRTGIASIEIFNRHGRSVYSKTGGYTNEWFGQTDDGDELVTGTYYYVIKLDAEDKVLKKQVLTGWIYINREIQ